MLLNAISYLLGNCILLLCPTIPDATLVYGVVALSSITVVSGWLIGKLVKTNDSYKTNKSDKVSLPNPIDILTIANIFLRVVVIAAIAFSWAVYQAKDHQDHILSPALEQRPITIVGYVVNFPQVKPDGVKFNFVVQDPGFNLGTIKLTWQTQVKLELGQRWQFTVRLKRPRGFANPGSFDVEKQSFQQRITAIGYVDNKAAANAQLIDPGSFTAGQAIRRWLHTKIITAIGDKEFVGPILALTLGLQQAVLPEHWQVLQQTGVVHLLAISGLHIGFFAGVAYVLATWLWRRMPIAWLCVPVPQIGAMAAMVAAYSYTFLAGFSVSARRSLLMVAIAMLAVLYKRKINAVLGFSWALIIVLILDPLAVLTAAFWLSFVAVAILLYTFTGKKKQTGVLLWLKPQMVLSIGLLPLGISYFDNVILIAPLANLIVIPYVNFLVIPLALLGVIIIPLFPVLANQCLGLAEWLIEFIWPLLLKLQALPLASMPMAAPTSWQLILAAIGIIWLLAPHGFPGRIFGLYGPLVLFACDPQLADTGAVKLTMLDVGQGLSVVLATKNHTLLYDTGPKFSNISNAGELVVWPYLRSQGISHLDKIIVSHADLDHAGGLDSLVQHIIPQQILTPTPEELTITKTNSIDMRACRAGQHWEWDGVQFEILHPRLPLLKKRNDHSCVLKVSTESHSILFTGDISSIAEKQLLANYADKLSAEILLIPHHGSASSSASIFIEQVAPLYGLVSVGYLNRYGHPKPRVVANYQDHGSKVLDTVLFGAIDLKFDNKDKNIEVNCYRIDQRKFWNNREYDNK